METRLDRASLFLYLCTRMSEFKTNKAVFVGVILEKGGERKVQEYLDELAFLAETSGALPDKMFTQRLDRPDKATYIGPGKLEEIKEYCQENEIEYVIFDDELTGMQQRNIEKVIACSDVIDRTSLILEIFAQRAKTSYAKMQVELAHYNYMLPRLAGPGNLCPAGQNLLRQNAGGAGPLQLHASAPGRHVDAPGAPARRYGNPRRYG